MDLEREKAVQKACSQAIKAGIILSAHDVSDGGLAVALAEACLNPDGAVGARVDIGGALRPDDALFGEAQSRIVVSFHEDDLARMKEIAQGAGATFSVIGRVGGCSLQIGGLIDIALESAKDAWSGALDNYIRS